MDEPSSPPPPPYPESTHLAPDSKELLDRSLTPLPGPPTPTRRSSESSTARSEYFDISDTEISPTLLSARGHTTKLLEVYHTSSRRNYRITTPSGSPLYYVDNSRFKPETPDVTLHTGSEKSSPVLGTAKFSTMFSKHISIGLGDPNVNGGRDMTFYVMERQSNPLRQSEFRFSIKIHPSDAHARSFAWKRSSKTVVGDDASYSLQNFKLIDGGTGEVVGTFANNGLKSWRKKGKFRLVEGVFGETWETLALLTGLCLIERVRRRNRASGAAGGVGGAH